MVDLRAKPYFLNDAQIGWVERTVDEMTLDEKLGQLFVLLKGVPGVDEAAIERSLAAFPQGGLRWQGGDKETVYRQNMTYQKYSKVPLFIAANCDDGGNGCLPEGTFVSTAVEAGATGGVETAYHIGLVAGREASAIGCNWMFNPVCDIYMNWRNTIVNTRAFGDNADTVLANCRAYIRGIKDANPHMASTAKHFPGDGVEELDQHLAMGVMSLSTERWRESFGRVYRGLIDDGLEAVMVGHFAFPAMSREKRPGIQETEILPATLAPRTVTGAFADELGFNGLIITDASHMVACRLWPSARMPFPGPLRPAATCSSLPTTRRRISNICVQGMRRASLLRNA